MPVVRASSTAGSKEVLLIFYTLNFAQRKIQRRLGGVCKRGHCAGMMSFHPEMHGVPE